MPDRHRPRSDEHGVQLDGTPVAVAKAIDPGGDWNARV
jgi:hypothetical protein